MANNDQMPSPNLGDLEKLTVFMSAYAEVPIYSLIIKTLEFNLENGFYTQDNMHRVYNTIKLAKEKVSKLKPGNIEVSKDNKAVRVYLDIIDSSHVLNVNVYEDNLKAKILEACGFLIYIARNFFMLLLKLEESKGYKDFILTIDSTNSTIYFVETCPFRIGFKVEDV